MSKKTSFFRWLGAIGLFLCATLAMANDFESQVQNLSKGSYSKKAKAVIALATIDDPRVEITLNSMQDGNLYSLRNGQILIQQEDGSFYNIVNILL